jgi:hypothetical protein
MKPAAKLIKDRLAGIGIPRCSIVAVTGANGVAIGHSFDRDHRNAIVANASRLAGMDLGVIVGQYDPCGCVFKAIVTTDPRRRGQVTHQEMPDDLGHECAKETAAS